MLALEALTAVLDVWLNWGRVAPDALCPVFDATSEGGLGAWLGVTQTALVALTLGVTAALYRRAGPPRARRTGWAVLAACFAYLAADDGTGFHERVGTAFAGTSAAQALGDAFPSYYWQVALGPLFLAMGGFMLVFLWRALPARRLRLMVAGALALLALAVVLDFVEGLGPAHPLNVYARLAAADGLQPLTVRLFGRPAFETVVHLGMVLEETIEMAAMTVLWGVVLTHVATLVPALRTGAEGEPPRRLRAARTRRPNAATGAQTAGADTTAPGRSSHPSSASRA